MHRRDSSASRLEPAIENTTSTIERLAGELMTNLHMLAEVAVVTGVGRTVVKAQIPHPTKPEDLAMRPLQIDISPNITPWREFRKLLREAERSWEDLDPSEAAE